MSEKPKIRGLEKFKAKAAAGAGEIALSTVEIRGLEKFGAKSEKSGIIPDEYDISPELVARVEALRADPSLKPFEDPRGELAPGTLLTSRNDPEHRRLITNMYLGKNGQPFVRVHIEGSPAGLHNKPLDEIRAKIAEGSLRLPEPPKP